MEESIKRIALSWKVKELDYLGEKERRLHSDVKDLLSSRGTNNEAVKTVLQVIFRPFDRKQLILSQGYCLPSI